MPNKTQTALKRSLAKTLWACMSVRKTNILIKL